MLKNQKILAKDELKVQGKEGRGRKECGICSETVYGGNPLTRHDL